MRIISGIFKGRKLLDSSNLKHLRPTSDKNRETLFNILNSAKFIRKIGFEIQNANVLDICCGSGSVAFEALSRGAKSALLIDNNLQSLNLAKANAKLLGVVEKTDFLLCDVVKNLRNKKNNENFDLIFIDPPYKENYLAIINNLIQFDWIEEKSLLAIEVSSDFLDKLLLDISELKQLNILENRSFTKLTNVIFLSKNKNLFTAIDS